MGFTSRAGSAALASWHAANNPSRSQIAFIVDLLVLQREFVVKLPASWVCFRVSCACSVRQTIKGLFNSSSSIKESRLFVGISRFPSASSSPARSSVNRSVVDNPLIELLTARALAFVRLAPISRRHDFHTNQARPTSGPDRCGNRLSTRLCHARSACSWRTAPDRCRSLARACSTLRQACSTVLWSRPPK